MVHRFFLLGSLLVLVLAGCASGTFGSYGSEIQPVTGTTVVRTIQYLDENGDEGPAYNVSIEVPEPWVGEFETRSEGNSLFFDLVREERRAPIFFIEALSESQYWEQIGSYPGQYTNLKATPDTYFIYHLPIDAYYSGLSEEEFEPLLTLVPEVLRTFSVELVDRPI